MTHPPIDFIPFAFPGISGVRCAFTTRRGGASSPPFDGANLSRAVGDAPEAVARNIDGLTRDLGISAWTELNQVHGTDMIFDPDETAPSRGDGAATNRAGLGLVIKTADCQPIMLAHISGRYVAGLHCGWRGNRAGFPQIGVRAFCTRYGLHPEEVLAVRGPSLGPGRSEFVNFEAEWGDRFRPWFHEPTRTVNLWQLTGDQLLRAGLLSDHIFSLDLCTFDLPHLFFSYRREGTTGRQAGVIWIK